MHAVKDGATQSHLRRRLGVNVLATSGSRRVPRQRVLEGTEGTRGHRHLALRPPCATSLHLSGACKCCCRGPAPSSPPWGGALCPSPEHGRVRPAWSVWVSGRVKRHTEGPRALLGCGVDRTVPTLTPPIPRWAMEPGWDLLGGPLCQQLQILQQFRAGRAPSLKGSARPFLL